PLQFQAFGLGRVGGPPVGRQPLLLEPLRLTPFGLLALHLESVRLEAFLTPALPLQLLRLLGGSPPLGIDLRGPLGLDALSRQFLREGAFGLTALDLTALGLDPRLLQPLDLQAV